MPGIGNCHHASFVLVALRFYHEKLRAGEWVELGSHPNGWFRQQDYFPTSQWEHACRAARRLALVIANEVPGPLPDNGGTARYMIRKPLWETVTLNLVALHGFNAGGFDSWLLSPDTYDEFRALPLYWRTREAREMLGEHADQFLRRTRVVWQQATGREIVDYPDWTAKVPKREGAPPKRKTLQWKLRGVFNAIEARQYGIRGF
jgi:hypothetical protein